MNTAQLQLFTDRLLNWYDRNRRTLPWRENPDPYSVWISEVMLQQTTVGAVEGRFESWMGRFPDIESVAGASEREVLAEWEGLGYYQRARRLHAAARKMVEEFDGDVPRRKEDLRRLPGIGPYIASAIRSIAFGADEVALDANLRRVFMRLLALRGRPSDRSVAKKVSRAATTALPEGKSSSYNQGLMDFGSLICRSRSPDCGRCFATDICGAYQDGLQEEIPRRNPKKTERIETAVAVFLRDTSIYIQRRPAEGLFGGMWEFPGGKLEAGETPEHAVMREVREELGVECEPVEKLTSFVHYYTRFRVTLHAFICEAHDRVETGEAHRWVPLEEIEQYPMPSANRQLIGNLRDWMGGKAGGLGSV